jgi:hypothetical protein
MSAMTPGTRHTFGTGLLVFAVLSSGCATTRAARLYNLDTPDVITASYRSNGSGHGAIWIGPTLETASCSGEYSTVDTSGVGWGAIYGNGAPVNVIALSSSGRYPGVAVVRCADGRVIQCEYLTGLSAGAGSCRDNRGHHYRLLF